MGSMVKLHGIPEFRTVFWKRETFLAEKESQRKILNAARIFYSGMAAEFILRAAVFDYFEMTFSMQENQDKLISPTGSFEWVAANSPG